MPTESEKPGSEATVRHSDGRVCRYLPYALDGVQGLLHAYFYGAPPEMRKCLREHGLSGQEGDSDDSA